MYLVKQLLKWTQDDNLPVETYAFTGSKQSIHTDSLTYLDTSLGAINDYIASKHQILMDFEEYNNTIQANGSGYGFTEQEFNDYYPKGVLVVVFEKEVANRDDFYKKIILVEQNCVLPPFGVDVQISLKDNPNTYFEAFLTCEIEDDKTTFKFCHANTAGGLAYHDLKKVHSWKC